MPESDFEILMDFVLAWEGRVFEDDPDDPGGATKYGLCLRSLKQRAQSDYAWLTSIGVRLPADRESIRALTERQAYRMYARYYWDLSTGSALAGNPEVRCSIQASTAVCREPFPACRDLSERRKMALPAR